jgi:hypothetical protein
MHQNYMNNLSQQPIDAGASLHLNNAPTFQHINTHFREGEALTLSFLNLKYDPLGICVLMSVGIGEDPGFNASTTHQQKTKYHPFQQHL